MCSSNYLTLYPRPARQALIARRNAADFCSNAAAGLVQSRSRRERRLQQRVRVVASCSWRCPFLGKLMASIAPLLFRLITRAVQRITAETATAMPCTTRYRRNRNRLARNALDMARLEPSYRSIPEIFMKTSRLFTFTAALLITGFMVYAVGTHTKHMPTAPMAGTPILATVIVTGHTRHG
jgi:hypothetical protein